MTGLLKDIVNERADAQAPPQFDLDGIVRTGDRRIRRRRTGTVLGATVAVVAVLAAGLVVRDQLATDASPAGTPDFSEKRVVYGRPHQIHFGDRVIDLQGHRMVSFVQTDGGFVFTDKAGGVFFADGREVMPIGNGNTSHRLAADETGSMVGWVEQQNTTSFIVYDTRRPPGLEVSAYIRPNSVGPFAMPVIDDGLAYVAYNRQLWRWNVRPGRWNLIRRNVNSDWLHDVAAGRYLFDRDPVVSTNPNARGPRLRGIQRGFLSPSGTRVAGDWSDTTPLFDARTGRALGTPRSVEDHHEVIGYQWLDDETLVAVGTPTTENGAVDLMKCSVESLRCEVVVRDIAEQRGGDVVDLILPTGLSHDE